MQAGPAAGPVTGANMPQIQTFTADLASQRGLRGAVQADISADAAAAPYRELERTGEQITRAGALVGDLAQQRQKETELRWAGDSADELSRTLIEWQEANKTREDIGAAYREFADRKLAEYESKAPSPRAAQVFRRAVSPAINSDWERNLKLGESIRFDNFKVSERKSSITANDVYRQRYGMDATGANLIRMLDLQTQLARIETAYGKAAPKIAAQMKESAVIDAVTGTAERDPDWAGEILEGHKEVDPETRRILVGRMEATRTAMDGARQVGFADQMEKSLNAATALGIPAAMPSEAEFMAVYGKDAAPRQQAIAKETYRATNLSITSWNSVKDLAGPYQMAKVEELANAGEKFAAQKLSERVSDSLKAQNGGNVMAHLRQNYEDVEQSYSMAGSDPARLKAAHALALKYQGPASPGTPEKEAKRYLGHSTGRLHLLTERQADEMGAQWNGMGPEDLMKAMEGLAAQYPDDKQRAIVYRDMVTLPKEGNRLKAGIQFAQMIPSQELRRSYLNVVQNSKAVADLTTEKRADFETALIDQKGWLNFRASFGAQDEQMADFRQAVLHYAYHLSQDGRLGLDAAAATKRAVEHLIDGSFGFYKESGVVIGAQKLRDDFGLKPIRTDAEIASYGPLLTHAKSRFPLEELSLVNPAGQQAFPQADLILDPAKKMEYVRKTILANGFFNSEDDGQGVTLYVRNDKTGLPFQLLDKKGKPFLILYDNLGATTDMQVNLLGISGFQSSRPSTVKVPKILDPRLWWENLK